MWTHFALGTTKSTYISPSFSINGSAEIVGYVMTRELNPDKFLRFGVDDGTDCTHCILWLKQFTSSYFSKRRITGFWGMVHITISDVVVEVDPNAQVLHWLDCVRLARKCYGK
ncbi:CST complex subunit STN1 [Striga hermonthica]|uniref:CST complex subunit STN1 n=1 Tax=Striga hermonthica TaxID=68872 RepID=A0A9N7MLC4_STRHE|nr:CST complex subunit STN1 [Striga hermonthica]